MLAHVVKRTSWKSIQPWHSHKHLVLNSTQFTYKIKNTYLSGIVHQLAIEEAYSTQPQAPYYTSSLYNRGHPWGKSMNPQGAHASYG